MLIARRVLPPVMKDESVVLRRCLSGKAFQHVRIGIAAKAPLRRVNICMYLTRWFKRVA